MTRRILALAGLLLIAGCSDSVTLVSADQVAKFVPGKTDENEVIAQLGKPLHVVEEADGSKIDQYPFEGSAIGGSILPSWLGFDDTPSSYGMVSFSYDRKGVLQDARK